MVRIQAPDSSKDVSFHVLFHVKFGHTGCCDFSINISQNPCSVTWLLTWNITFWVKYIERLLALCYFWDLKKFALAKDCIHYEKKLTKNIRPTDILQIYTSI